MTEPGVGTAVVSGAGSGIGRAIAVALARRGHALALLGRRLEPLAATLELAGGTGTVSAVDVRDAGAVAAAVRAAEARLGPLEVVVPSAGVARVAPFVELSPSELEDAVATNLLGAANLFHACLPSLLARRRGALIALLSVAARQPFPGWSAYAASKFGLLGLCECLRSELVGTGVRVTAITPGATASPLWDDVAGTWDRALMIPATEVARAVVWALEAGERMAVEEIRLRPLGGDL